MKTKKTWMAIAFLALIALQLFVLVWHIYSYEAVLKKGEVFYLKVTPVDPFDPFRGRYVALEFEGLNELAKNLDNHEVKRETSCAYAVLQKSENKPDSFARLALKEPQGESSLKVLLTKKSASSPPLFLVKALNSRYYMREDLAPLVDMLLRGNVHTVFAKVRVLGAQSVIEDLVVSEVPVSKFIEFKKRKGEK